MSELLPEVDTSGLEWQAQGSCRHDDPGLFFGPDGERGTAKQRRDDAAKAICQACIVREECLQWALDHDEVGIWGGTNIRERRRIKRVMTVIRPDIADVA